ncbi:MAG: HIT family protein [Phycisphaerales bacterium]|nr:HIT family protein [Phycisphaerales bacterium]
MAGHQQECEICTRVAECRAGKHPGFIAELDTGFAVLGDSQQFRGYTLFLSKTPATELHQLARAARVRFIEEMTQVAEAVHNALRPHKLNCESLGNVVHHVHWHIFPRRKTDIDVLAPVWGQMHKEGTPEYAATKLDPAKDAELIESIRAELVKARKHEKAAEAAKAD